MRALAFRWVVESLSRRMAAVAGREEDMIKEEILLVTWRDRKKAEKGNEKKERVEKKEPDKRASNGATF